MVQLEARMQRSREPVAKWGPVCSWAALVLALGCGASDIGGGPAHRAPVGDGVGPTLADPAPSSPTGNNAGFGDFGNGAPPASGAGFSGCPTTLSGITRDPAGQLPL